MKKQRIPYGGRLTATVIPADTQSGLERAKCRLRMNIERAVVAGNKEVAMANRKVLRQVKAALTNCEKYNGKR